MLSTIPGLSSLSAEVMVSEIGIDMSCFHIELIAWAALCPKNDESAGKRRSNRIKKGAPWLKTTLVQCAWAATRKKGKLPPGSIPAPPLQAWSKEGHCRRRRSILTAAYHLLKNGTLYQDLGANHFDQHAKGKHVLRLVNRLQNLGFAVHITPMAA
jgi:transposase